MAEPEPTVDEGPDEEEERFQRLYGRWLAPDPQQVVELFGGAPFRWWIAGGWAVEAGGGRRRRHDDTDVAVLLQEVDLVREWLSDYHLWEAHSGTLRPLVPDDELRPGPEQLWVRRDATQPWLLDLVLTPTDAERWLYKRDHRVSMPLAEIGVVAGGATFLRPCLILLYKARLLRPKDEADFRSLLPCLPAADVAWLDEALALVAPEHPWRDALA